MADVEEVWLVVARSTDGDQSEHILGTAPHDMWKIAATTDRANVAELEHLAWMISDPAYGLRCEVRHFVVDAP